MLFKEIVDGRTDARTDARTTDDGRRTLKDHKSSLSTSCSGELKSHKIDDCKSDCRKGTHKTTIHSSVPIAQLVLG